MKKLACRYAIAQFLPYAETGEFANIGVVLVCPATGYFGFKLQSRRFARVTNFFDEISAQRYRAAIRALQAELVRLQRLVAEAPKEQRAPHVRALFSHLVSPRETLMRFGDERAILADDPEAALEKLFGHYVDRNFATPEYVEKAIGRRLRDLLTHLQLPNPFRPENIGNDEVHASFPLVQRVQGELSKAIKPFNLDQAEPNDIYVHGDAWVQKIKRLRQRRLLPPNVLFAVQAPSPEDPKRWHAFEDIRDGLQEQEVEVRNHEAEHQIIEFARAA